MIDKTRLGIPFFDHVHGGIYRKRPMLCCGRHHSGKTLLSLHSLMQAVSDGEQALLLSSWRAKDLGIIADKVLGFSLENAVSRGQAILLEYAGILTNREFEENVTLPPDSFTEFMQIVESRGVTRVILDTVLPWVAIRQKERLGKHVFSFMQALERMGVTAILTLPKPVSPLAFSLKKLLEEQVPVVLNLSLDEKGHRTLTITKQLGETVLPPPMPFEIIPGRGLVPVSHEKAEAVAIHPDQPAGTGTSMDGKAGIRYADAFRQ